MEDFISLQPDLTTLDLGTDCWRVKCNLSKCEVTRITPYKNKSTTRYQVSGTELRIVSNDKDLGSEQNMLKKQFTKQTRYLAYLNAP